MAISTTSTFDNLVDQNGVALTDEIPAGTFPFLLMLRLRRGCCSC